MRVAPYVGYSRRRPFTHGQPVLLSVRELEQRQNSRCSLQKQPVRVRPQMALAPRASPSAITAKGERSMVMSEFDPAARECRAWNAGRKVGAKRPLKPRQVWAIRFFLDQH